MPNKVQVTIRMISQVEYGEEVTQEEFDKLVHVFNEGFSEAVRIGNSIVPMNRVEIIYKE